MILGLPRGNVFVLMYFVPKTSVFCVTHLVSLMCDPLCVSTDTIISLVHDLLLLDSSSGLAGASAGNLVIGFTSSVSIHFLTGLCLCIFQFIIVISDVSLTIILLAPLWHRLLYGGDRYCKSRLTGFRRTLNDLLDSFFCLIVFFLAELFAFTLDIPGVQLILPRVHTNVISGPHAVDPDFLSHPP